MVKTIEWLLQQVELPIIVVIGSRMIPANFSTLNVSMRSKRSMLTAPHWKPNPHSFHNALITSLLSFQSNKLMPLDQILSKSLQAESDENGHQSNKNCMRKCFRVDLLNKDNNQTKVRLAVVRNTLRFLQPYFSHPTWAAMISNTNLVSFNIRSTISK